MATDADIARLRLLTSETLAESTFTDAALSGLIDAYGINGAAAEVWSYKAAEWAELVNTSEGDARRDMSDLLDHAERMVTKFQGLATAETSPGRTRVRKIVRT